MSKRKRVKVKEQPSDEYIPTPVRFKAKPLTLHDKLLIMIQYWKNRRLNPSTGKERPSDFSALDNIIYNFPRE